MDDKKVILKSSDGEEISIGVKSASNSKLLKGILEDYTEESTIPLPEVKSKELKEVIKYLDYIKDHEPSVIPRPLKSSDLKPLISEWEFNFLSSMKNEEVLDLINSANYMDINPLLQLTCARIASEMIDKPVEEVRKDFGIECDMTKEEAAEYDKYPID